MSNQQASIDYADLRSKLTSIGEVPPEALKAGFEKHVATGVASENIEAFYQALCLVAKKCDDEQFKAYVETGEMPVVQLSAREMEIAKGGTYGYGASYQTSSSPPSIGGFVTYLFTGYINGYKF